jgi:hypothetical protein
MKKLLIVFRYVGGIIRTDAFTMPMSFEYQPLGYKTDPELVDFFDGHQYRDDVIDSIDQEVYAALQAIAYGRYIPVALRKLVCYAVWGNPVEAYKYYEYSFQDQYMPHKYLPEHIILQYAPKAPKYTEPLPTLLTGHKRHRIVRLHMARAKDQGVGKSCGDSL